MPNGASNISALPTGVASGSTIVQNLSGQDLTIDILPLTPFGLGEFITLTNSLSLGTTVSAADFSMITFEPLDIGGNVIPGITAEVY
jgi:hypothetical protein